LAGPRTDNRSGSLEAAKKEFEECWRKWKACLGQRSGLFPENESSLFEITRPFVVDGLIPQRAQENLDHMGF
jgi:hypothetical protein